MKGGDKWQVVISVKHRANTLAHLSGCFIGECNGKNFIGKNSLSDKMADARRQYARLTAAGTGQNRYWTVCC